MAKCPVCDAVFAFESTLQNHMKEHRREYQSKKWNYWWGVP